MERMALAASHCVDITSTLVRNRLSLGSIGQEYKWQKWKPIMNTMREIRNNKNRMRRLNIPIMEYIHMKINIGWSTGPNFARKISPLHWTQSLLTRHHIFTYHSNHYKVFRTTWSWWSEKKNNFQYAACLTSSIQEISNSYYCSMYDCSKRNRKDTILIETQKSAFSVSRRSGQNR